MDEENLNDKPDILPLDEYRKWKKKLEKERAHREYYRYPGYS